MHCWRPRPQYSLKKLMYRITTSSLMHRFTVKHNQIFYEELHYWFTVKYTVGFLRKGSVEHPTSSWPCCVQIIERLMLCRKQSPGLEWYQEGRYLFISLLTTHKAPNNLVSVKSIDNVLRNGAVLAVVDTQSLIQTRNFPYQQQDAVWWFRSMCPFLCGIYAWQHVFSSAEVYLTVKGATRVDFTPLTHWTFSVIIILLKVLADRKH